MQSIYGLTETTATVFQSIRGEDKYLAETTVGYLGEHIEAMVYITFNFDTIFFLKICIRAFEVLLIYLTRR